MSFDRFKTCGCCGSLSRFEEQPRCCCERSKGLFAEVLQCPDCRRCPKHCACTECECQWIQQAGHVPDCLAITANRERAMTTAQRLRAEHEKLKGEL